MNADLGDFADEVKAGNETGAWNPDGSSGDETGVIEPADTPTQIRAWSSDDTAEPAPKVSAETGHRSWRNVWPFAVGLVAVGVVAAAIIAGVGWGLSLGSHHKHGHPRATTTAVAAPAPIPAPPPPSTVTLPVVGAAPPLDGTYRIDNDYDKMTVNSRLSPFSGKGPRQPSWSEWYGFRSVCTAAGCVATGTKLDRNNLQAPDPNLQEPDRKAITYVLRWAEGAWQGERTYRGVCSNGGDPRPKPRCCRWSRNPTAPTGARIPWRAINAAAHWET
jgi:hypothetical protein